MSPTGQFICFLVGLILLVIATLIRLFSAPRAIDFALVSAALGFGFLVLVVNAAEAM
jgi:hypothetical protein